MSPICEPTGFIMTLPGYNRWFSIIVCGLSLVNAQIGPGVYVWLFLCNWDSISHVHPACVSSHASETQGASCLCLCYVEMKGGLPSECVWGEKDCVDNSFAVCVSTLVRSLFCAGGNNNHVCLVLFPFVPLSFLALSSQNPQRHQFALYSEYCNNHPQAVNELNLLQSDSQFALFFEVSPTLPLSLFSSHLSLPPSLSYSLCLLLHVSPDSTTCAVCKKTGIIFHWLHFFDLRVWDY